MWHLLTCVPLEVWKRCLKSMMRRPVVVPVNECILEGSGVLGSLPAYLGLSLALPLLLSYLPCLLVYKGRCSYFFTSIVILLLFLGTS